MPPAAATPAPKQQQQATIPNPPPNLTPAELQLWAIEYQQKQNALQSRRNPSRKENWDKIYESSRKGKRHGVKLPVEYRTQFVEPYDHFLTSLLDCFFAHSVELDVDRLNPIIDEARRSAPRGTGWTVWLSTEARERYRDAKQLVADAKVTHSEMVYVMLKVQERFGRHHIGREDDCGQLESLNSDEKDADVKPEDHFERVVDSERMSQKSLLLPDLRDTVEEQRSAGPECEPLPPYGVKSAAMPTMSVTTSTSDASEACPSTPRYTYEAPSITPTDHEEITAPPYRQAPGAGEATTEPLPPYLHEDSPRLGASADLPPLDLDMEVGSVRSLEWGISPSSAFNLLPSATLSMDTMYSGTVDGSFCNYFDDATFAQSVQPSASEGYTNAVPLLDQSEADQYPNAFGLQEVFDEPLPSYEYSIAKSSDSMDFGHDNKADMDIDLDTKWDAWLRMDDEDAYSQPAAEEHMAYSSSHAEKQRLAERYMVTDGEAISHPSISSPFPGFSAATHDMQVDPSIGALPADIPFVVDDPSTTQWIDDLLSGVATCASYPSSLYNLDYTAPTTLDYTAPTSTLPPPEMDWHLGIEFGAERTGIVRGIGASSSTSTAPPPAPSLSWGLDEMGLDVDVLSEYTLLTDADWMAHQSTRAEDGRGYGAMAKAKRPVMGGRWSGLTMDMGLALLDLKLALFEGFRIPVLTPSCSSDLAGLGRRHTVWPKRRGTLMRGGLQAADRGPE
ncbi:uncharacterized protein EV422DRAFT_508942 [Fimicolochytrium jonesii]|uniref:uncharacterized protein n=1 Tax=Fimicolochytrium jonesii TaxID=1396493 RepID=UPI0022FF3956|nr:uncharacterized protein EV422DRAFT_508942 [Fimicolochytrium jonesii]KAI8817340.1 hypothetical protein EV422DRAFT_508942 [Fimicolochytrium jonesii]